MTIYSKKKTIGSLNKYHWPRQAASTQKYETKCSDIAESGAVEVKEALEEKVSNIIEHSHGNMGNPE